MTFTNHFAIREPRTPNPMKDDEYNEMKMELKPHMSSKKKYKVLIANDEHFIL